MTIVSEAVAIGEAAADRPAGAAVSGREFRIRLANFDGPFDLLLQLISRHRLDITDIALHVVTDEFIAHLKSMGDDWDLDQATEFLVVAATLLDLKAARLLPSGEGDDEDDLALLEARDLLFARLLALRAYQQVATLFRELEAAALRRYPRAVTLEARYLGVLPEVEIGIGPAAFADLAAALFRPKPPPPQVSLAHLHMPRVSVAEHTEVLRRLLAELGEASFTDLVAGCDTLQVVARFLGLLHLYREAAVQFDQPIPLGPLTVRWSAASDSRRVGKQLGDHGGDDGGGPRESEPGDRTALVAVEIEEYE